MQAPPPPPPPRYCSLCDLAPSEKAKVAQLMRKIVEQSAALQEAQEAAAAVRGQLQAAVAQQAALSEQNAAMARDNSSLRAKLTHALALLKTYQHKIRTLHATGQPAAMCGSTATIDAQEDGGWRAEGRDEPSCVQTGSTRPGRHAHPEEGSCCISSSTDGGSCACSLSPIKEGSKEGVSPSPQQSNHQQQKPCWRELQEQQQQQQPLQAQLGPLTLLARALLEAQAEMLSSRQQQLQQQPQGVCLTPSGLPTQPTFTAASSECVGAPGASSDESARSSDSGDQNESANSAQSTQRKTGSPVCVGPPCGSQFIVSSDTSACSMHKQPYLGSPASPPQTAHWHAPAQAAAFRREERWTRHMGSREPEQQRGLWQTGAGDAVLHEFDSSLLDIVTDVEGLLWGNAAEVNNMHVGQSSLLPQPVEVPSECSGSSRSMSHFECDREYARFEENDVLSVIAALNRS